MTEIMNSPRKTAPDGNATIHDGLTLKPLKSMMLPATIPVAESPSKVLDIIVMLLCNPPADPFSKLVEHR